MARNSGVGFWVARNSGLRLMGGEEFRFEAHGWRGIPV